jgi:tetratricopeptide (TPR) repeat protein
MEPRAQISAPEKAQQREPSAERAVQKASALLREERFGDAERLLSDAIAEWPGSALLLTERGALLGALARYDEALEAFEEALKRDERNERALQLRIKTLRLEQRFQAAGEALADALHRLPESTRLLDEREALLDDLLMTITDLRLDGHLQQADQVLSAALKVLPFAKRGALLFDLGQYAEALRTLDEGLMHDESENDFALQIKLMVLRQERSFDVAEKVLSEELTRRSANAHVLAERGALLFDLGQYDKALDALNEALKHDPSCPRALQMKTAALRAQVDLGIKLMYVQDYEKAMAAFDEALQRDECNESALQLRALVLRLQERFQEAEEVLANALAQQPLSARLLAERGALLFDLGQYDKALEVLNEALRLDASDERAMQMKAAALHLEGYPRDTDEELSAAVAGLEPDRPAALLSLSLRQSRRFREAERVLSDALIRRPGDASLLAERGALLFDLGQYDKALDALNEALKRDASNELALQMRIMTLRLQERFQEAGEALTDALARRPLSASLLAERGALLFDLGQYDKAITTLDRVLERYGREEFSFKLKSLCLRRNGAIREAKECLRLGISQSSQQEDLFWELGQVYLSENDNVNALESFNKATGFAPTSLFPLLGKARSLRKLGLFYDSHQLLATAEERYSDDVPYLMRIAVEYLSGGNYAAAWRVVNACKVRTPREARGL